jgi:hypothetical protein
MQDKLQFISALRYLGVLSIKKFPDFQKTVDFLENNTIFALP